MKKRNLMVALLCSMCLAVSTPMPAMADASKVVTLGADLTDAQKNTMMKYFKADSSQVQIVTVTNKNEHEYLGKYVPSAQIGTRTLSCAYVKPTQSGGIKVRTANLNYVTCNMIATALSTAGVNNCEAVAACPMEVSGTGALTGVMMAYETASGQKLDSTKKDLATKEVVVTGDVGTQVGKDNATNIINQAKMQIIADNVQNADDIYNIVNNVAIQNGINLTADELNTITELLQEIAQQKYDIEEMKKTLESIQKNLEDSKAASEGDDTSDSDEDNSDEAGDSEDSEAGDDITEDVDPGALGKEGEVKETYTEDASKAEETGANTNEPADVADEGSSSEDDSLGIPEATTDGTYDNGDESESGAEDSSDAEATDEGTGDVEATDEGTGDAEQNAEASGDTATEEQPVEETTEGTDAGTEEIPEAEGSDEALSAEDQGKYDQAQRFCQGEYGGDLATLQGVVADATEIKVTLDGDTADKLTKKVLEAYMNVLKDGGMSYVMSDTDSYSTPQVNMLDTDMKQIFSIESEPAGDDILVNVSAEDRQTLYDDTMKFFADLYGDAKIAADSETTEETAGEEGTEGTEESTEDSGYDEEYGY